MRPKPLINAFDLILLDTVPIDTDSPLSLTDSD